MRNRQPTPPPDALLVGSLLTAVAVLRRTVQTAGTLAETAQALRGVFATAQQLEQQARKRAHLARQRAAQQ